MCEELQDGSLPLLVQTPNGRGESGTSRDCFILNPNATTDLHLKMFNFLGMLLGIAIRTGSPLNLSLVEPIWKLLVDLPLTVGDLSEMDKDFMPTMAAIKDMSCEDLERVDLPFRIHNSDGLTEVTLSSVHSKINIQNREEYIKNAIDFRLHEFDQQVKSIRRGMASVIPLPLLTLATGSELETQVCGNPEIPIEMLKSVTSYKGVEPGAPLVHWFWSTMEEFSNEERSLFLRFVWGRTRLPRTIGDFRGKDFVIQVSNDLLAFESSTKWLCFSSLGPRQVHATRRVSSRVVHLLFPAQVAQIFEQTHPQVKAHLCDSLLPLDRYR